MTQAEMLAIVNARVWTADPTRPWADAIAIQGDRVAIVGSSAEVRKLARDATIIDAAGGLVAPASSERENGMLRRGMLANLVLLVGDLTRIAPETIRDARIRLRIVGGRIVFDDR
jgi:predicted amidohydrolase YtcJ